MPWRHSALIERIRRKIAKTTGGTPLAEPGGVANANIKTVSEPSTLNAQPARPACDEWGFYDPEQAGFEAVLRKLEKVDEAKRVNPSRLAQSTT